MRANRARARRKGYLVLAGALLAFLIPAALLAGFDLGGLLYPAKEVPDDPTPEPLAVGPGTSVSLEVVGTLDNGTVFLSDTALNATIGSGTLVPGLEQGIAGLHAGDPFNITVAPQDGYGLWAPGQTSLQPLNTTRDRLFKVEAGEWDEEAEDDGSGGPPRIGDVLTTIGDDERADRWPATVVAISSKYVTLRYEPAIGDRVSLNGLWNSTVTGFNETKIFLTADVWVGFSFARFVPSAGGTVTSWVVAVGTDTFTVDTNHPLAGQTLHFQGTVKDVRATAAGAGPAPTVTQSPVLLSGARCTQCHSGFSPVSAWATGTRSGGTVAVDVSVEVPWRHELTPVKVEATLVGGPPSGPTGSKTFGPLTAGEKSVVNLEAPAPAGSGNVSVVVNATAYHQHTSGTGHDTALYQVRLMLPVNAPGGNGTTTTPGTSVPVTPAGAIEDPLALVARGIGFGAVGIVAFSAYAGAKRHLRKAPRYRRPTWLTTHFTLSVTAMVMAATHGLLLMSGSYRGDWSVQTLFGVAALLILGGLGVTGIIVAKWFPLRWPRARRLHYLAMSALLGAAAVHIVVSSTTLHDLIGY
jgi:FKBP-type peptidyl-prolyl cis-trans isomerase 2